MNHLEKSTTTAFSGMHCELLKHSDVYRYINGTKILNKITNLPQQDIFIHTITYMVFHSAQTL